MAKIVGSCIYVHKSNFKEIAEILTKREKNLDLLQSKLDYIVRAKLIVKSYHKEFNYEIVKYDLKKNCISFIDSPDWLTANEPEVGDGWRCDLNSFQWKFIPARKNNKQIYHGKWRFVDQSFYKDFDVIESYNREKQWQAIPGIKEVKKYIGNKDFWVKFLNENGIEV